MSAEISISHIKLEKGSCSVLLESFQKDGIVKAMRIQDTYSLVPYKNNIKLENGCLLRFRPDNNTTIKTVWQETKKKVPYLNCANLHILGQYDGCILDYLRPTKCAT